MEPIKIYDKNSNEYKKLEFACAVFNENGFECYVENTWFDYGQKWDYTAILCKGDWGPYQFLYPNEYLEIIKSDFEDLKTCCQMIVNKKHKM